MMDGDPRTVGIEINYFIGNDALNHLFGFEVIACLTKKQPDIFKNATDPLVLLIIRKRKNHELFLHFL